MLFGIKSVLIYKKKDSEPVYNKEVFKAKISHGHEATDFYDKEISKVDSSSNLDFSSN